MACAAALQPTSQPHVHVLACALAGRARRVHSVTALFHHHRLQRKGRFANDTAATVRLTQRQVLQMHRTLQVSTNLNPTQHDDRGGIGGRVPDKAEGGRHRGGNFQIVQPIGVLVHGVGAHAQHDRGVLGGVGSDSFQRLFHGGKILRDVQRKAVRRVGTRVGPMAVQRPANAAGQGVIFVTETRQSVVESQNNGERD